MLVPCRRASSIRAAFEPKQKSPMSDQITCSDCGGTFVFTDAEREFYESKGLAFPPKRCKSCRQARKSAPGGAGPARPGRPSGDRRPQARGAWGGPGAGSSSGGPRGAHAGPRGDRPPARTGRGDRPGSPGPAGDRRDSGSAWGRPGPFGGRSPAGGPNNRPRENRPPFRSANGFPAGGNRTQHHAPAAPAPAAAARARPERPKYSIHCATCGIHAEVPFKPIAGREVFCQPCYRARRGQPAAPPPSIDVGDAEAGIVE